ncbi:MAG: helix-turn-helix domain-containing protein [Candidatus Sphingomonas colombiensis]|nr:helix-turn-helix domain-containing protein [Sphingomonas sp.]WEK43474.1 MAG: helix-turn-helix domain-containing protein [Sphingomonas sp.]
MRLGTRRFEMPLSSFTGPTNVAGWVEAQGGTVVGIGLHAEGWARLFGGDLSAYANRVVPLSALDMGADALRETLDRDRHPPAAFEQWLDRLLASHRVVDPRLARLEALITDATVMRIEMLAEELNLTARQLGTLTRQNFGFTPKVLLRRRRFLRALSVTLDAAPEESGGLLAAAGYWDRSHFLRDAHLFLGCSIREFRQRRGPLHALVMQTRADVLGAPV